MQLQLPGASPDDESMGGIRCNVKIRKLCFKLFRFNTILIGRQLPHRVWGHLDCTVPGCSLFSFVTRADDIGLRAGIVGFSSPSVCLSVCFSGA